MKLEIALAYSNHLRDGTAHAHRIRKHHGELLTVQTSKAAFPSLF